MGRGAMQFASFYYLDLRLIPTCCLEICTKRYLRLKDSHAEMYSGKFHISSFIFQSIMFEITPNDMLQHIYL